MSTASIVLLAVGVVFIVASFFLPDSRKKEDKSQEKQEDKSESSVFDETASLDTPSEKVLDDKEKKMIDRIVIEATALKNG